MATLIIRPNGDGATHTLTCSTGSTHYVLIDEAGADDADYVKYTSAGSGAELDIYAIANPAASGVINSVKVYARAKALATGENTKIGLQVKDTTTWSGFTFSEALTTSWASYVATYTAMPRGGDWTWADIDALLVRLDLGVDATTSYCSQIYVEVDYTPPVYFDSIECLGMSNGYANVRGILKAGCSAVDYKEAQIDHENTFASPLADTTELAAAGEDGGDTISLIVAWSPASAGTYYARLGVRAHDEAVLAWITVSFVVQFPIISAIAISPSKEHVTVTVTVSDDYADPPEVTVMVDGQTVKGRLN